MYLRLSCLLGGKKHNSVSPYERAFPIEKNRLTWAAPRPFAIYVFLQLTAEKLFLLLLRRRLASSRREAHEDLEIILQSWSQRINIFDTKPSQRRKQDDLTYIIH